MGHLLKLTRTGQPTNRPFPSSPFFFFKTSLRAKSLLWISVFIHIEIVRTNYHNRNFTLRLALKERLSGTLLTRKHEIPFCNLAVQWGSVFLIYDNNHNINRIRIKTQSRSFLMLQTVVHRNWRRSGLGLFRRWWQSLFGSCQSRECWTIRDPFQNIHHGSNWKNDCYSEYFHPRRFWCQVLPASWAKWRLFDCCQPKE